MEKDEPVRNGSKGSSVSGESKISLDARYDTQPTAAASPDEGTKDGFALEPPVEARNDGDDIVAKEDFSVFSVWQKRFIIMSGSFVSWLSPMSGSIYYPALDQIANDLHVSSSRVNLTVTTYLIVQGLAPMMVAGFSDRAGRRPAYILCLIIYIIANLALALQNNYYALLFLRMLQSAGSSGTIALVYGLVGDLVVSSERGQYIAFASVGTMLGPTISPVLGGVISQFAGWHWIFWFLLILSCVIFVPLFFFFPETCRKIVGDASVPPPKTSWNISDNIRFENRAKQGIPVDEEKLQALRKNYKITVPNPLLTLTLLADLETAAILICTGMIMACFYAISAGASTVFHSLYGFDDLYVSFMFLPLGGGSLLSSLTTGRLIDWNYRRHARRLNFPIEKNRFIDLSDFPIERVRLEVAIPLALLTCAAVTGYGWCVSQPVSLAGPIIILFFSGYFLTSAYQVVNALIIDIHPGNSAPVTAANNLVRCELGAAASAAIVPMSSALGNGWAYTILALITLLSTLGLIFPWSYGLQWRKTRKAKELRKQELRDARRAESERRPQHAADEPAPATSEPAAEKPAEGVEVVQDDAQHR